MPKLTVRLEHDDECPYSAHWKLYSFNRRHANFKHPEELGLGPLDAAGDPKVEKPALARKLKNGTAFIVSYYEHGNSLWFLRGDNVPGVEFQWDGVRVAGLLVWDSTRGSWTKDEMKEEARDFLETYTSWVNGEVYRYHIENESGECLAHCSGNLNSDVMLDVIAEITEGYEVTFVGNAKWLAERNKHEKEKENTANRC